MSPEELSSQIMKMSDTISTINKNVSELSTQVSVLSTKLTEKEKLEDERRDRVEAVLKSHAITMKEHSTKLADLASALDEGKGAIHFCQAVCVLLSAVMVVLGYWRRLNER